MDWKIKSIRILENIMARDTYRTLRFLHALYLCMKAMLIALGQRYILLNLRLIMLCHITTDEPQTLRIKTLYLELLEAIVNILGT